MEIKSGDIVTISGIGLNASGDTIVRSKNDNKPPPFWGINQKTGKRGKAIKLKAFTYKCTNS